MASSNYDVNVQLALATTAEFEGDLDSAIAFLAEAHTVAHDDRKAHAQVHWFTAWFQVRHDAELSLMKQASLRVLASVF